MNKPTLFVLSLTSLALPQAFSQVETALVTGGPWEKNISLPAEAFPYHRVHLGTSATGWIEELRVDIGSRVKAGDILAIIHAPELDAAHKARAAKQRVSQAASVLRSAEASMSAVKSETTRITALAKSGTVTNKARDEANSRLIAAEAKVGEAEAGITAAEADALAAAARETEAAAALEYTRIKAPFDGVVVERKAEPGDFLGPASMRENLFTVEQTETIRVRLEIPEHAAGLANAGDPVSLKIAGQDFNSELTRVSGSLDPVTKTMLAEVDLPGAALLPRVLGSGSIELEKLEKSSRVPLSAVRTGSDGSRFVMVLEGEAERKVLVKLAAVDGKMAILSEGPAEGEKVVIP
ncbi:efflux RND transporter periplasmic adaptor subunit [Luteolibacter algae]|uniref:Efflux RND transporter periplasmic adaptor subunit n=1 Tax=Luteolibacter algae TaxID=454151 RepID=A0ABW5DCH7_9BACT